MKTVSICLEDSVYGELIKMLKEKGQSPQSFYESYTKTVLRDRSRTFVVCTPRKNEALTKREKTEAFQRLEKTRLSSAGNLDYEKERALALEEKLERS
nr:antitoxin [uncultured Oribacterium sp.]